MKRLLRTLCTAAAVCGLMLPAARAVVFEFSYAFGDGVNVTGTLTGTQNGQFVENVANVALSINGVPVAGTVFASQFDPLTFGYLAGPVLSFDVFQNNFVLSNSDLVNGDYGYDSLFYVLNAAVFENTAVAYSVPAGVFSTQDLPTLAASWKLAPAVVVGAVPEGGAAWLLGALALAGLLRARRWWV